MRRKIIELGNNCHVISLPIEWVRKHSLKKGDDVNVEKSEGSLIISCKGRTAVKECSLDIKAKDPVYIRTIIGALYRRNFSIIHLNHTTNDAFKAIEDAVSALIGFEIMETTKNSVTIKCLHEPEENDVDNHIIKLCHIVKVSGEVFLDDLKKGQLKSFETLDEIRKQGWKLRDYCQRSLVRNNFYNDKEYAYHHLIWSLEKLVTIHHLGYRLIGNQKFKIPNNILSILTEVEEQILFFTKNLFNLREFEHHKVKDKLMKLTEKIAKAQTENPKFNSVLITASRLNDMLLYLFSTIFMINS